MRTFLGVLAVFAAGAAGLVLMLTLVGPDISFGLLSEAVMAAGALGLAVATAYVVMPRE